MEYAHKRFGGAFNNLHYLALAALVGVLSLLAGHCHADLVPVEGMPGLGRLDEHIVFLTVHYHENESFSGHLDRPRTLREHPASGRAGFSVSVLASVVSSVVLLVHND